MFICMQEVVRNNLCHIKVNRSFSHVAMFANWIDSLIIKLCPPSTFLEIIGKSHNTNHYIYHNNLTQFQEKLHWSFQIFTKRTICKHSFFLFADNCICFWQIVCNSISWHSPKIVCNELSIAIRSHVSLRINYW